MYLWRNNVFRVYACVWEYWDGRNFSSPTHIKEHTYTLLPLVFSAAAAPKKKCKNGRGKKRHFVWKTKGKKKLCRRKTQTKHISERVRETNPTYMNPISYVYNTRIHSAKTTSKQGLEESDYRKRFFFIYIERKNYHFCKSKKRKATWWKKVWKSLYVRIDSVVGGRRREWHSILFVVKSKINNWFKTLEILKWARRTLFIFPYALSQKIFKSKRQ